MEERSGELTDENRETFALIFGFSEGDAEHFILRLQVLDLARQPLHFDFKLAHLARHGAPGGRHVGRRRRSEGVGELPHRGDALQLLHEVLRHDARPDLRGEDRNAITLTMRCALRARRAEIKTFRSVSREHFHCFIHWVS